MTARDDLIDIVTDVLYDIDQALPYREQAVKVADALSERLHAQVAVERGGMEPAVWQEPADRTPMGVCEPQYYPYPLDEELGDDTELGYVLLYRLSEEAPTDG